MMAAAPIRPPAVQTLAAGGVSATPPSTPQTVGAGALLGSFGTNASLYVGDLEVSVDEAQLFDLFNQVAPVLSVRVCRDLNRRSSLGYAYVNFSAPQDAAHARELLNFTPLGGKPIRIMFSHRDPSMRKSGYANIFIKNLDSSIDNKSLYDIFATFGSVLSCKVALDRNGQTKGYGFVQFDQDEAAQKAIEKLDGMLINGKKVYVGHFVRQQERNRETSSRFTNVYLKNLPETTSVEDVKILFGKYGSITSSVIMKDENGKSRGFGFVNFETPDSANAAVENLNGTSLGDKVLYAGKAQKKSERLEELTAKFEQEKLKKYEQLKASNLYMKNLDETLYEEELKGIFSEFGTIASCKVMRDQNGISKGAAFIAFSSSDEAKKALDEMNGKMVGGKPLYVAIAQRKDERRAWLQAHFAQIGAGRSYHHPGASRVPMQPQQQQQLYYGQGPPPPPPTGFGFPGQILRPNYMMSYQFPRQGQQLGQGQIQGQGQRASGARRNGNPQQRNGNRYMANGRSNVDPQSGVPTLASALASASPENQRMMLGEQLYPLVENVEREHAGKVTGMLLEMDQTEVLHLIEDPDALKKKVAEAMDVLQQSAA